jgi:membrane-associated phospholipid phosphatase
MQSSKVFNTRYVSKLSGWVILLLVLFGSALSLFIFIIHEVLLEKEEVFDQRIFNFLQPFNSPQATSIMNAVSYCASSGFLQIAYTAVGTGYLLRKNWKRVIEIGVIGAGGYLVSYLMKYAFQRDRPADPLTDPLTNSSFPSGHAVSAFIFYGLLIYLISKARIRRAIKYSISCLLVIFALLIGFSRVYLRMHYPTDVIAGFCIGLAWITACIWLMENVKKNTDKELERHKAKESSNT